MLEFPEVINLSRQLRESVLGMKVEEVLPPTKEHKFCWFNGDVRDYDRQIRRSVISDVNGFGIYVELSFNDGHKLCINDGVNVRFLPNSSLPMDYQLLINLDSANSMAFSVAMYGGIVLHDGSYDNEYYLKSKNAISPFDAKFEDYFFETLSASKPSLSAKAFLATEQRFPGIGNGVLQDILFNAEMQPKRKISTLSQGDKENLLHCTIDTLKKMTDGGGRDTEKNLYGETCGYKTLLSKNTINKPCPRCGATIVKEPYLGGAVYYCPNCQSL